MNLKDKRKQLNMTQADVAKLAHISREAYTNIEIGRARPSINSAKSIGAVLGIPWTAFFEDETAERE